MSKTTLTLPAFAKINLSLRVLGKRADGYHELDTIFQTISLKDSITLAANDDSQVDFLCDDRSLPPGKDNLVYRAAKALQLRFASEKGARIHLEKRIPAQAGLGGGSSDAAVTLIGLAHLWELSVTRDDFISVASQLGADVPFFFSGGTARGTGIGSEIELMPDVPGRFLLVVKPNASVNTADAYKALDEHSLTTADAKTILFSSQRTEFFGKSSFATLHNDFEAVAFDLEPKIGKAKVSLMNAGAVDTLLAGSGSAVFGIFDSEDAQRRAIQTIELETGWRVFPCKTVARDPYRKAMGAASEIFANVFGR